MNRLPRHRPARRLDPAQILEPTLELPEDERVELYTGRYQALVKVAGRHDGLRRLAEQLIAATAALGVTEADDLLVTLAAVRVARYWRTRPMPPGSRLFPRIATTAGYFEASDALLHWLDIPVERVAEALERAEARPPRLRHGPHHSMAAALALVTDALIAQAPHDPLGTAGSLIFRRVVMPQRWRKACG